VREKLVAEGEMKLADRRWAKEKAHLISRSGPSTHENHP